MYKHRKEQMFSLFGCGIGTYDCEVNFDQLIMIILHYGNKMIKIKLNAN